MATPWGRAPAETASHTPGLLRESAGAQLGRDLPAPPHGPQPGQSLEEATTHPGVVGIGEDLGTNTAANPTLRYKRLLVLMPMHAIFLFEPLQN